MIIVLQTSALRKCICCYLETRSRSKVSGAYESERDNVKTYILVASFGLIHLL